MLGSAGICDLLFLWTLLQGAWHARGDAHSLIVNITAMPTPRSGQPWCEAQVGVVGEPCFSYDCQSDEVKPLCAAGMKVEAPLREEMRHILKDLTTEFRGKLLEHKPEDFPSEPLSLQAPMVIQEEAGVLICGSWQFVINGRISLHLNLMNRTWTVDQPGDMGMLEKWEKDRDMNQFLLKTSHGDCRRWLQGVSECWEILGKTAPPSLTPDRDTPKNKADGSMPWLIPVILFIYFIVFRQ